MKKHIIKVLILSITIVLTSCASNYYPVNPSRLPSTNNLSEKGIDFSYRYNVLHDRGNEKLSKKEQKRGIKIIAVKITNNTDSSFTITKDVGFFVGNSQVYPEEPFLVRKLVNQTVASYLPYLLFTSLQLNLNGTVFPIGYALGPLLTAGNMLAANNANNLFYKELKDNDVINLTVKKGETIYGLVAFSGIGFDPLTMHSLSKK